MVRYIIIGYQRSGTTVSHLILKGHPGVSALDGELKINPFYTRGLRTFTGGHLSEPEIQNGHSLLFNAISSAEMNKDTLALGAKTVCNSPQAANIIVETIKNYIPDLKIILIVRDDMVAQYGSSYQHQKTGVAHSWYKQWNKDISNKVKINKLLFKRYVVVVSDTYKQLRRLKETNEVLEISYERFSEDNDAIYREMLEFIGLTYQKPDWLESQKVLPSPEKYIRNYHEMYELMKHTRRAFDEDKISAREDFILRLYAKIYNLVNLNKRFNKQRGKKSK